MTQSLQPFSSSFTSDIPDILTELGCSIALTTYQAGKVIFISADRNALIQLARTFNTPMGITHSGRRMGIVTLDEVVVFANDSDFAWNYPKQPETYDAFYLPRSVYYTGTIDLHDIAWGEAGLWGVNTLFSSLSLIDEEYSFTPKWTPPFIRELQPEDRCHLNGMAMADGAPKYVTALGESNHKEGWRENKYSGGIIMEVPTKEILFRGLSMPHSPRVIDDKLYFLNSAAGEVMAAEPEQGIVESVNQVPGYARGLAGYGDYLFVGTSQIREKHQHSDMPIAKGETFAGIVVIHRPTGRIAGSIRYHTTCKEIYDVAVLPGVIRPGILNHTSSFHRNLLSMPGDYFYKDMEEFLPEGRDCAPVSLGVLKGGENPNRIMERVAKGVVTVALLGGLIIHTPDIANAVTPSFTEKTGANNPFNGVTHQLNPRPTFIDIDNDSDTVNDDIFIGKSGGEIIYYNNTATYNTTPAPTLDEWGMIILLAMTMVGLA